MAQKSCSVQEYSTAEFMPYDISNENEMATVEHVIKYSNITGEIEMWSMTYLTNQKNLLFSLSHLTTRTGQKERGVNI